MKTLFGIFVLLLVITGCGSNDESLTSVTAPNLPPQSQSITPTSTAMIFFPQQALTEERVTMTAELIGLVVIENNCLRVQDENNSSSYLIIWPPGASLNTNEADIHVVDANERLLAVVGKKIRIDGGEVKTLTQLESSGQPLSQPPPNRCNGPYWLAGDKINVIQG